MMEGRKGGSGGDGAERRVGVEEMEGREADMEVDVW